VTTVGAVLNGIFEPGFFTSGPVRVALVVGGAVSLVSAVVGVFTVVRGQSFAGHSLGDLGTTGGSGAFLVGANPLWGFVTFAIIGAGAMELFGARRPRGRDMATGIVLGAGLGIAALFLYLGTTESNTTGATITILFGSIFVIHASMIPVFALLSGLALAIVGLLYRPLLLSAVSQDIASARGVPVRAVGILLPARNGGRGVAFLCDHRGDPQHRGVDRTCCGGAADDEAAGLAIAWAAVIGLAVTWLGILLAYDSYYWPPAGRGWPVSFFVVALILVVYLLADLASREKARRAGAQGPRASSSRPARPVAPSRRCPR